MPNGGEVYISTSIEQAKPGRAEQVVVDFADTDRG
jgi:hypothetical protein